MRRTKRRQVLPTQDSKHSFVQMATVKMFLNGDGRRKRAIEMVVMTKFDDRLADRTQRKESQRMPGTTLTEWEKSDCQKKRTVGGK
jgi:hypothetical protein